jgi:hypothetical protein
MGNEVFILSTLGLHWGIISPTLMTISKKSLLIVLQGQAGLNVRRKSDFATWEEQNSRFCEALYAS